MMLTAKHPVRAAVANLPNYFDYKNDAVNAVHAACAKYGIEVVNTVCNDYSKDAGRVNLKLRAASNACVICEACAAKSDSDYYGNVVVFSWYTTLNGRIELTVYVS